MISVLREWRHRALRFLHARHDTPARVSTAPRLDVRRIESLAAYRDHVARMGPQAWQYDLALAEANPDVPFKVDGRCWIDNTPVAFEMDYLYAEDLGTRRDPNWRERMLCPICHLNNRQRASIHVATEYLGLRPDSRIYMTEQVTPAYALMRARHASVVGSEFLSADAAPGSTNDAGIRHEDLTRLSFPDASFDAILTFDVLEHIPDHRKALAECQRVLKHGGRMLFSIPFLENAQETRTRARFDAQGTLVHDHPPAYHGDPVNPEQGVLCFHEFGWDILDHVRAAGFSDAKALAYRDPGYGYLGGWPLLFAARK
jgi:SAM-dependent methyltransferase